MPKLEEIPEPDAQLPEELRRRIRLAWEAQCAEGFAWGQLSHLRYVDVPGLRFVPTLADVAVNAYSSAWRMFGLAPLGLAITFGLVVWTTPGEHSLVEYVACNVPIALLVAVSVFLFVKLGRQRPGTAALARDGLYFTPNLLTMWDVIEGKPDRLVLVERAKVGRIYERGVGTRTKSVWLEYQMHGESRKLRTGLPGLGGADRAWFEGWRATGELPLTA